MKVEIDYDKRQVIQALRYHFISRKEMRIMIILVNVFAVITLVLYAMGKVSPTGFLLYSFLWIVLMVSVWFVLPTVVHGRADTFKHHFTIYFNKNDFTLEHQHGRRSWPYTALQTYMESPNFFHLYYDSRSFLLVPKSGFASDDDIHALRELLNNKVKQFRLRK